MRGGLAIVMTTASVIVDHFGLSLIAIPVAATGSVIGLFARRARAGRVAAVFGLVALLLSMGGVLMIYGRAMAGLGAAG